MIRKWYNAEEIIRSSEQEENNRYGARKVFQRKEYSIYKASDGYIIHNTNKTFKKGHTHVQSFKKAKSLVDLAIRKKLPDTPKEWELVCLMRITNNNTYYNKLRDLLEGLKEGK